METETLQTPQTIQTKLCKACCEVLPLDTSFRRGRRSTKGTYYYQSYCIPCQNTLQKAKYKPVAVKTSGARAKVLSAEMIDNIKQHKAEGKSISWIHLRYGLAWYIIKRVLDEAELSETTTENAQD